MNTTAINYYLDHIVTDAHMREMMLEAQTLLLKAHPYAVNIIFLEDTSFEGVGLVPEADMVIYDPVGMHSVCLNDLCKLMNEVFTCYGQMLSAAHPVPAGTLLN